MKQILNVMCIFFSYAYFQYWALMTQELEYGWGRIQRRRARVGPDSEKRARTFSIL